MHTLRISTALWLGCGVMALGFGGGWLTSDRVAAIPIVTACEAHEPVACAPTLPQVALARHAVPYSPQVFAAADHESDDEDEELEPQDGAPPSDDEPTPDEPEDLAPEGAVRIEDFNGGTLEVALHGSTELSFGRRITDVRIAPPLLTWTSTAHGLRLTPVAPGTATLTLDTDEEPVTVTLTIADDVSPEPLSDSLARMTTDSAAPAVVYRRKRVMSIIY